jgi:hypothetical protein
MSTWPPRLLQQCCGGQINVKTNPDAGVSHTSSHTATQPISSLLSTLKSAFWSLPMEEGKPASPFTLPGRLSLQDPLGTGAAQAEAGRQLARPASMGPPEVSGRAEFSRGDWAGRPALYVAV